MKIEFRETLDNGAMVCLTADNAGEVDVLLKARQTIRDAVRDSAPTPTRAERAEAYAAASRDPVFVAEMNDLAPPPAEVLPPQADPSERDIIAAFRAYTARHPLPEAVDLLAQFGVKRVTELGAERYAEFIAATGAGGRGGTNDG